MREYSRYRHHQRETLVVKSVHPLHANEYNETEDVVIDVFSFRSRICRPTL